MDAQLREYARRLGLYWLKKHDGDYDMAAAVLLRLQVTNLRVRPDGSLEVTTSRPGLFIGARGENVQGLEESLGVPIRVVEDSVGLYDAIIPRPEPEYPEDYLLDLEPPDPIDEYGAN